ncbi:ChuX/HutX family heme-like substrate-binding protein [Marinobacter sp. CHS3-4]|uniref:hemin-degrading factor n=1 Tax=Marinobacter sp. CHS3-4 TaxID=3045174 RepID=UPI0024B616B1|nr:ChuX/HutX family heme-like substrate-binding protein [Marinobacter sp. CHS3-4]MDI9244460.1 ChuX/HutX family heme-like substrate-binding protein [Marinobacter sp. CHS3-4]
MEHVVMAAEAADQTLASRFQALQNEAPKMRIRQMADELGVSEMELVRLRGGKALIPLQDRFGDLLKAMESVGPVMILTRNNEVVHEVTGTFKDFTTGKSGAMGLAVGEMDVRVFFKHWAFGYRVQEQVRSGLRESLQFFDHYGAAVHKIYRIADTRPDAWESLVQNFSDAEPKPFAPQGKRPVPERARAEDVKADVLREGWGELKDVHHFGALLKRAGTDRLTALELLRGEWSTELERSDGDVLDRLLELLQDNQCPAMFFVGNPGIVQIFTGKVSNIRRTGPWMNVLDPGFNLHANTESIKRWWLVRRPSADGIITSLEAFNADGELVLTVFGERKPGIPESELWRERAASLEAIS